MSSPKPSFIEAEVPFGERTSLAVGGNAAWGAKVSTAEMLDEALRWARDQRLPWRVFGEGSNTLVSDVGFQGLLIEWLPDELRFADFEQFIEVDVDAGAHWDTVVAATVARGAAGIECLSGIPGTAGAAPIQNIGAYGQELSDVAVSVTVWDTILGCSQTIPARSCAFRYRDSRFKSEDAGRFIVTGLRLRLRANGAPTLTYRDLVEHFDKQNQPPSVAEVRDAVTAIRRAKSMVLDEHDPESRSAGSFFMNPVLDDSAVEQLSQTARERGIDGGVPSYAMGPGLWKTPAAWLIERAGIKRGFTLGDAHVSKKHTLALVADAEATATDIVSLARHIRATVREFWGVSLSPEPGFVGFDHPVHELLEEP